MCWLSMWRMTAETVTMAVENKADIINRMDVFIPEQRESGRVSGWNLCRKRISADLR